MLKTVIPLHFDAVKCKLKQNLNFDKIIIVIGALPHSVIYKQNWCRDQKFVLVRRFVDRNNIHYSNEDMSLALAGQYKQLSHVPEKFRWLNGIQTMTSAMPVQLSNEPAPASQRSWVRIPLSHLNFSGSWDNCLNCPASARIISSFDFKHRTSYNTLFILHSFTGKHEPNKLTCFQSCVFVAQLVKALHWHRRVHGFESLWVTWFFQVHETVA